MRPEEFTRMLNDRPGSLTQRGAGEGAKARLREAFEQFSQENRARQERLEKASSGEALRIWEEAGQAIKSDKEGVTEDA